MKFLKLKKKRKEYAYMVKMYNKPPYYDEFNNVPMSKKEIEKNKEKVINVCLYRMQKYVNRNYNMIEMKSCNT